MSTSLSRPDGYADRVALALAVLSGMSIAELAKAFGRDETTVWRWRSGKTVPSDPATLARLVRVDLGLLVYGPTERLRAALDAVTGGG